MCQKEKIIRARRSASRRARRRGEEKHGKQEGKHEESKEGGAKGEQEGRKKDLAEVPSESLAKIRNVQQEQGPCV